MRQSPATSARFRLAGPLTLGAVLLIAAAPAQARKKKDELPTVAEKTDGFTARRGFLAFHTDDRGGKIWLEVPPPEGERREAVRLLYVSGLLSGLGSNPVGLDRGQIDDRPPGAAEPRANLWDNGDDPVAALETILEVRRLALERFGEANIAAVRP